MKRTAILLFAITLLFLAGELSACPLCQGGSGGANTLTAYRATTVFLALLPIIGAGGIFYWLKNRYKKSRD